MKHSLRQHIIVQYTIIFYVLMIYKWLNGMWMYQFQPSFFYTREDLVTWLFMRTGIHQWPLNNQAACILFDILFYSAPLPLLTGLHSKKISFLAACWVLLVN